MLLKLDSIHKSYPNQTILNGISLEVPAGSSIAITGPSGSGKTTLLNIIGTLDKPDSGTILFDNKNISLLPDAELSLHRNSNIGFIFQMHYLLPQFNVIENVLLPTMANKSLNKKEKKQHAEWLLNEVGLFEHKEKYPAQLSGGECQRTAFARALIMNPKLILADEPTGSLDNKSAQIIADLLCELNNKHKTALIIVTHSAMLAGKTNNIYSLQNGSLLLNKN